MVSDALNHRLLKETRHGARFKRTEKWHVDAANGGLQDRTQIQTWNPVFSTWTQYKFKQCMMKFELCDGQLNRTVSNRSQKLPLNSGIITSAI
jgi:hypothetical protein